MPTAVTGPVPLLVMLHGDGGQSPLRLVEAWERFAAPRGVALLALACPRELGCAGSWWQWDGDPAWLGEQVRVAAAKLAIDPARVALLGWSGGASYLGRRLEDLGAPFSAVVFHGGGIPPYGGSCAKPPLPTYFLVGDKNPLHHLAVRLRDDARRCGHDVTWDLLPGADHAGEWKAEAMRGEAVLAWLAAQRATPVVADAGVSLADAGGPPRTDATAGAPRDATAPRVSPVTRARAGCQASPGEAGSCGSAIALTLVIATRRRRISSTVRCRVVDRSG